MHGMGCAILSPMTNKDTTAKTEAPKCGGHRPGYTCGLCCHLWPNIPRPALTQAQEDK